MGSKNGSKYSGKVLILGTDTRAFLAVIRSLGRQNICIHVCWCSSGSHALLSRYISKVHEIPQFSLDNDWKEDFKEVLEREKFDIVIPCTDSTIIPLQLFRKEFESICKIYLLEDKCFRLANDKFKMQKLAKFLGVKVPKEIEISKSTEAIHVLSELSLPVVLKPRSSFTQQSLGKKNFVLKIFSAEELQNHLNNVEDDSILCAQENFIGTGVGVELLACAGEILYSFQHIRIHEPLTGGGSSYRKSVCIHPELLAASEKIIKELNYTGVAMVEFKMNFANNDWVFIEINARFWGSLPLAVAVGADFPYFLYSMLIDGEKNFNHKYKKGIYCRNISMDINWFLENLKADHSNPFLETVTMRQVAAEVFNLLLCKERNDTLVFDDMGPALAEIKNIIFKIKSKIITKVDSSKISRALQNKKISTRINLVKRILFVCKGNICRSPFAHYYLRSILPSDFIIESCGYFPKEGRHCPPTAIAAAKKLGINLSLHRSVLIHTELVQSSDIIFTFDEENLKTIIGKFPFAKSKTFRISSLDIMSPFEISDPYNQDVNCFYETYRQIKVLLDSKWLLK